MKHRGKTMLSSLRCLCCATALIGMMPVAQAAVYVCETAHGTVYTNKPQKGCGTAQLGKIGSYTSDNTIRQRAQPAANPPVLHTRAAAPRTPAVATAHQNSASPAQVSAQAQQSRDAGRRQILAAELANERKALADAQRALAEGRALKSGANYAQHQEQVRQLESAVSDRQQNIQAIQNEINRI